MQPPEKTMPLDATALTSIDTLRAWLASRRGARVELTAPQRGEKMALVRLCESNAREMLR